MNPAVTGGGTGSDFDTLCQAATRLVALLPHPPATLKLQHGLASAELTWATGPPLATVPSLSSPPPPPSAAAAAASGEGTAAESTSNALVRAPLVGTFYHAPEPGAPPFVAVGDTVEVGQQVGIVESMKLMNPIVAEVAGRVAEILAPDATPVEYDQALVAISPTGDDSACGTLFPGPRQEEGER
ncbi:acetyl-CoA carboxylase biotin carboxyl carrier protein [Streptosporangium sp. NPDC000396]|uniref:acetyl-CoA carboxylase biotin carboxyl carrier protein n=1 Tax=Streptosporangium sp. NPDC000396 TaxID=3366185 RepID=UPI0036839AEB